MTIYNFSKYLGYATIMFLFTLCKRYIDLVERVPTNYVQIVLNNLYEEVTPNTKFRLKYLPTHK